LRLQKKARVGLPLFTVLLTHIFEDLKAQSSALLCSYLCSYSCANALWPVPCIVIEGIEVRGLHHHACLAGDQRRRQNERKGKVSLGGYSRRAAFSITFRSRTKTCFPCLKRLQALLVDYTRDTLQYSLRPLRATRKAGSCWQLAGLSYVIVVSSRLRLAGNIYHERIASLEL
jgi:hypothetical protein